MWGGTELASPTKVAEGLIGVPIFSSDARVTGDRGPYARFTPSERSGLAGANAVKGVGISGD